MKNSKIEIINTKQQVSDLVDWLVLRHEPPVPQSPTMYIDLEGVALSREGSVSIFTLLIDTGMPAQRICLIDVHVLGGEAFNTSGAKRKSLKDILQDGKIPKVFFDVRNDSDALFAHFGVALQGVEDVQLMESATRRTTASRKFVSGLAKCLENNLLLTSARGGGRASWKLAKEKVERLFKAEHGGYYEVFIQRPIPKAIVSYCVGDVQYLPELRAKFWKSKTSQWRDLVKDASQQRVAASQMSEYQPNGPNRAISPWSTEHHRFLDQYNYVAPPRDYFDEFFEPEDDELDQSWESDGRGDNDYEDWTGMPS